MPALCPFPRSTRSALFVATSVLMSQAGAEESTLPEVVVSTTAEQSYAPPYATGATRTETPSREVPQSVRVLSRSLIDDVAATRMDGMLDYASGVSRQNNLGGLWDNYAIRGFTGNENTGAGYLVNGFAANRGYTAPRDTATIDRIEVLKGPSSSLYGSSEPGGVINVVTRQPQFKPGQTYDLEAGNRDHYRAAADITGALTDNVAGRLIAVADHDGSTRDFVNSQRYLLAPSVTWALGASTLVQYSAELQRYTVPLDRGVVAINGRLGAVPRLRFLGEPNDGDIRLDSQSHQLSVEHEFSDRWKGRVAMAYRGGSLEGYSTEASALLADGRTLTRQRRYRDYQSDDVSLQADITGKVTTGPVGHELLFGVDTYRFSTTQVMLRRNPSATAPYAIDIFDPVYGQSPPALLPNTNTYERQTNVGLYAQDQLQFGERWRVVAGARFDIYNQSLDNRLRGTGSGQHQTAVSPRIGLTYLATHNIALFANASRSFRPNAGSDAAGNAFAPEHGRAAEAGIKVDSTDRRTSATLAVFEIRKRNVLTTDPADAAFQVAAGEARSRGVELDVSGQLDTHWRLTGNFAYTDAEITQDSRLAAGTPLANIPRVSGSVMAIYEDKAPVGQRYGVGAGVRYVGSRSGDAQDSFSLPAYTLADLLAYWQYSKTVRVSLNVNNLFDRTYYASSYSSVWVTPGAGRTVRLGLRFSY